MPNRDRSKILADDKNHRFFFAARATISGITQGK
jgi:hypothetical protein